MDLLNKMNHNINSNRKYQYASLPSEEPHTSTDYSSQRTSKLASKNLTYRGSTDFQLQESKATELTKLRVRSSATNLQSYTVESQRPPPPDDVVYLEREIAPTDTLQSYALLYGCTLADIKRANNLIKEQDFFALRHIKIPVKRHGLLTEPAEESKRRSFATTSLEGSVTPLQNMHHASGNILVNGETLSERLVADTSNDVYLNCNGGVESDSLENLSLISTDSYTKVNLHKDLAVERNDTSKFLKKVDKEIRKTVRKNDELHSDKNEVLEEVVSSLGSVAYRPLLPPGSKSDDCDGADWGFKWWVMLLLFVVVVIIIVLVGVEYYLTHYQTSSNSSTNGPST